jgi:polysaccharide biosynthesis protein PslH
MARLAESLLHAGAEVEVLSLNPRKHRVADPVAPVPMHAVDIDTSKVLAPALASLKGDAPYVVRRFESADFRSALRLALKTFRPDVVQIESPFLLPYAELVRAESSARIVLRSLNVEFRIWELLARSERNPLRRLALRRVASTLRDFEIRHLDLPDAIVPISNADRSDYERLGCTRAMHVAPCAVALGGHTNDTPEPFTVGFIGSLDFRPNQEAVAWILDEMWPRVRAVVAEARLSITGSAAPKSLRERAFPPGARLTGFVDDAEAFLRKSSVVIAPLFAGGGMRIKVLEALAVGRPVVATSLGAGGIDVEDGRNIVLAEDAESFAASVIRLLRDPDLAERIGSEARAMVAERYDGSRIARGLLEFYAAL